MIREEYNSDGGLFLYTVVCDGGDCETALPPRGSEPIAIVDAIYDKWLMRQPHQKFSGIIYQDYCPSCKRRENRERLQMVSGVYFQHKP
jgi:hypothetical protein